MCAFKFTPSTFFQAYKISLIILSLSLKWPKKKKKKKYFTHQRATVFRFKMPLQTHRKRCSVYHVQPQVPTSFRGKRKAIWQELLSTLSHHPLPAQGSVELITWASPPPVHPTPTEAPSFPLTALQPVYPARLHTGALTLGIWSSLAHSRHSANVS